MTGASSHHQTGTRIRWSWSPTAPSTSTLSWESLMGRDNGLVLGRARGGDVSCSRLLVMLGRARPAKGTAELWLVVQLYESIYGT